MKKKIILSIICLTVTIALSYLIISSICSESEHSKTVISNIRDPLSSCLKHYIFKIDPFFLDVTCQCYKGCIFYHVYFFEKKNESYFMLFTFPYIVNRYDFTQNNQIYLEDFNDRKVVFFIKTNETKETVLYRKNNIAHKKALSELKNNKPCPLYSGSKYPETFKYKTENGNVIIEKADSLFYESVVGNDFARFENLFVTMPNGYRKNKTHE